MPFPPDYGGVLDVYLRAKALKNLGYYIILHCYEYGRGRVHDYREIADEVFYYKRNTSLNSFLSKLPYIVKSRNSKELFIRLMQDDYPILLEGQHSTYWAIQLAKHNRVCAVRIHNVEWQYYLNLAKRARNIVKWLYFQTEARKLKKQEIQLQKFTLLCISSRDTDYYRNMGFSAIHLPITINPELHLSPVEGKTFALYHGNLSISENMDAINILIEENKRSKFPIPLVIAGKNPGSRLIEKIHAQGWECYPNPGETQMNDLMRSCSMHLLIGFGMTGIKLKVVRALLTGKPCLATKEMVQDSVLEKHCVIWNPVLPLAEQMLEIRSLDDATIQSRIQELKAEFSVE